VRAANAVFGDMGPVKSYPEVPAGSQFRYPWADTVKRLAALPMHEGAKTLRYTNPLNGGPVIPTLDCSVIEMERGAATRRFRASSSQLCVVIEGSGESRVGEARHQWSARDIFTMPEWNWIEHRAVERARLLVISDSNFRQFLGLYREETQ